MRKFCPAERLRKDSCDRKFRMNTNRIGGDYLKPIIINIYLLVCACIGLAYGLTALYKKKQPMYFKLMIFPIACQVFSRAYYTVALLCYGELPDTFNIGLLGYAAFFLFMYLPNIGALDTLVDEQNENIIKRRLISLIIPTAEVVVSTVAMFTCNAAISLRISFVVLAVLAGFAGYFNMKHLIVADVENGIIRSIRKFNLLSLVVEILTLAEIGLYCFGYRTPVVIQALLGILYVVFLPFLDKEAQKWTR